MRTRESTVPSTQGLAKDEDAPMMDDDAADPKQTLKEEKTSAEDESDAPILRVLVTAGPYATSTNLCNALLDALLDEAIYHGPDDLILTEPFVDGALPLVPEHLPVAFDQLFADRILARISRLALGGSPVQQIMLGPALSDAFNTFVAP